MATSSAPPVGLVPKFIRDRQRAMEIIAAMGRYADAGEPIPRIWFDELDTLVGIVEPQKI